MVLVSMKRRNKISLVADLKWMDKMLHKNELMAGKIYWT